jgi:hypothetical protein
MNVGSTVIYGVWTTEMFVKFNKLSLYSIHFFWSGFHRIYETIKEIQDTRKLKLQH